MATKEENLMKAIEAAKFFMNENLDTPRNTFSGNMKLQKLLYFAQLISLAKYNRPLFTDDIFAFDKGPVIENVRQLYRKNLYNILDFPPASITNEEKDVLETTTNLLGSYSANDLSDFTHQTLSWKQQHENGLNSNGYHDKLASLITIEMLEKNEVPEMRDILASYDTKEDNPNDKSLKFNGSIFYYDPNNINANEIKAFVNENDFPIDTYEAFKQDGKVYIY